MKPSLLTNNFIEFPQQNEAKKDKYLTKGQQTLILIVALTTFYVLAIPALIVYILFKAKAIKNCKLAIQTETKKVTEAVSSLF